MRSTLPGFLAALLLVLVPAAPAIGRWNRRVPAIRCSTAPCGW